MIKGCVIAILQAMYKAGIQYVHWDYNSVGGSGVDVNMEAPISTEGLPHAGGRGADDNIGSTMLTYVDATDYEDYAAAET